MDYEIESVRCGGKGVRRESARRHGWWALFALQIHTHAFAADLNERVRHGAALALARVQAVPFRDDAAKNADVEFFGNDNIVDGNHKMIQ